MGANTVTQTLDVQMESMVQSDLEEASPRRLWVLSGDTAFPRVSGVKDTLNHVCWVNWIQRHKEGRKKKVLLQRWKNHCSGSQFWLRSKL